MTQKFHVTKIDNTETERAVQMRTNQPSSPVDKQIWYNEGAGNMSVMVGGVERVLNLRVLPNDPAAPVDNEAWINHTTSQLKYKYGGVIYTMTIGGSVSSDGQIATSEFAKTLSDAELGTIADISLNSPNLVIDSFNEEKETVTLTNAEIAASRLRGTGANAGVYQRQVKTSGLVNHADAIMVASVQGLQPETVTVFGGTQHKLTFKKDVTGLFGAGRKVMGFKVFTVEGKEKNIYMIDATTGNPKRFDVVSATYSAGSNLTTVTITTDGFDVTWGGDPTILRFFPFTSKFTAGGNASNGAVELDIIEAHNLEARRILGEEVVTNLEKSYAGGVYGIVANHSPDKNNWLILGKVRRTGTLGDDYVVWYSMDGLKTIQQATNFTSPAAPFAETHASANESWGYDSHAHAMRRELILVHDDGRFIFGHKYLNASSFFKLKGYYGKMDSASLDFRLFPRSHDQDGEITIGARTEYEHVLAMDWDNNCLAAHVTYIPAVVSNDPYIFFYKFNWDAMSCQYLNYVAPPVNYALAGHPVIMFWKDFEGERMLFWSATHGNLNQYAWKVVQANVLNIAPTSSNISAVTYNNGLGPYPTLMAAFTNTAGAGGVRNDRADWTNQSAAGARTIAWCLSWDETELLILKADDQTNIYLVTLNFARTNSGTYLHFPVVGNVTTVYQYSALGSMIPIEAAVGQLFNYEGGETVSGNYQGRYNIQQRMVCGPNNTIYITADWLDTNNANDLHRSRFIKIPNYQELRGLHYVNAPATPVNYFIGDPALGATYGKKLAQMFTIPTAANYIVAGNYVYPDGKVHIRTIGLYAYNSYSSQKTCNPNHKIKIKVCGLNGSAEPDLTQVLAESIEVPEMMLPAYPDAKWYPFPLTTDLRLAPGQLVAIVVEGNWDPTTASEVNPTTLATTTRGFPLFTSGAGSGMRVMNSAGTWVTVANSLYFRLFDMYYGHTSDMQFNPYYQGPTQINSGSSNEDSESSIAWAETWTEGKLNIIYRNSDTYLVNSNLYNGSHPKIFWGQIEDTFGPYEYPVFSTPKMMGDESNIDPYLVFGVNFGDESSRFINSRTGTTETMYAPGNVLTTEGYNNRAYGGVIYNANSSVEMTSLMSRTNLAYGIAVDADFASGKCLQFAASTYVQYRYGTYGWFPGAKDFCVEFEYKPSAADMDTGNQNMIISAEGFIRAEMQNGKYQFYLWGNPGETWSFRSTENVLPGHQIIRYGRTFAGGAFIQVSYNKGASWTNMTLAGGSNPMVVSGGRVLGLLTTGYDIIRFGDYSASVGTYGVTGSIGYVKFIVGASAPIYSGLIDMDAPLDFRRIHNFGDRAIALRVLQNTYGSNLYTIAAAGLMYFEESSMKPTRDQLFRYKGAVGQGREMYVKIDLNYQTTEDPVSIQGYLVNFEKKDV